MWQIIAGAIGWTAFAIPVFEGVLNFGNALGMTVFGCMFFWGIFRKKIRAKLPEIRKRKWVKYVTNVFCVCFCLLLAWTAVGGGLVIHGMLNEPPADTEILIVLGCKVNDDGPSKTLAKRLDAAYDYLTENPGAVCIVCGGQGDDEPEAEAVAMQKYLIEKGMDESRIITENKSTSTKENIEFAKEILEDKGYDVTEAAICTSDYHEFRACYIAKECGIKAYAVPASSPREMLATYVLREVFGIIAEVFFR